MNSKNLNKEILCKNICNCLHCIFNSKQIDSLEGSPSDIELLFKVFELHSLDLLVYKFTNKDLLTKQLIDKEEKKLIINLKKTLLFNEQLNIIYSKLNEKGIYPLSLKGIITNTMYPFSSIRQFADYDFYVGEENIEASNKIMKDLGYSIVKSKIHNAFYKDDFFNYEIHKQFMAIEFDPTSYFLKEALPKAIKKENSLEFSNEDFYLYNIVHTYKHYSYSGVGLRSLVDVFMIRKYFIDHTLEFDTKYIDNILDERFHILEFERNILFIIDKLVNSPSSIKNEEIAPFISNGTYGTLDNSIKKDLDSGKYKNKFHYLISNIFPSVKSMKERYPILNKVIILLPFLYIWRILKGILNPVSWVRLFKVIFKKK